MTWQFNLDGGVREEEVRDDCGLLDEDILESEDIHVYYDIWDEIAQDESTLLDDELNLHYLGHDLMESLDEDLNLHYLGHNLMESLDTMAAENQTDAAVLEDGDLGVRYLDHNLMESLDMAASDNHFDAAPLDDDLDQRYFGRNLWESLDMAADNQFDADDEGSDYGDADGSFAPNSFIAKMAQRCGTIQWEASLPMERIPRKAQGLYNQLCEWNFADAISRGRRGVALVEDDEVGPLDSGRKLSFEEGEAELAYGDGYCSDSSAARVRDQLVECRRVVSGLAYGWDILL